MRAGYESTRTGGATLNQRSTIGKQTQLRSKSLSRVFSHRHLTQAASAAIGADC